MKRTVMYYTFFIIATLYVTQLPHTLTAQEPDTALSDTLRTDSDTWTSDDDQNEFNDNVTQESPTDIGDSDSDASLDSDESEENDTVDANNMQSLDADK